MTSTQEPFSEATNNWDLQQLYQDLAVVKRQLLAQTKSGLTEVEKTHLRALLCGYRPAEIARLLNKDAQGLRVDLSRTLYRYVEVLTKRESNTLEDWRDIVNWLTTAGYKNQQNKAVDWGEAPEVPVFYGRTQELATLQQWIVQDRCHVVTLLGMGGIGKTALAVKLAELIQDEFEYFIWRSLRYTPKLESLWANLLFFFSNQKETQGELSQIIYFLCQHRCLIVLDEVDAILGNGHPVGHYRPGYEGYGELLRRVGEQRALQSCLVLTSYEKPQEIVSLEGKRLPVRSLLLTGLGEAANEIFSEEGLTYEPEEGQELIQMYRGNPLALKIVSTTIQDLFGGSVAEFLKYTTLVISDRIREILEQQFQRLSEIEKKILHALTIHHQPMSPEQLRQNISSGVSKSEIIEALDSLGRRSLIETSREHSTVLFTLQPVVMKYVKRIYEIGM